MSIGPPIPEIQHFQSLTLKIQGQGHSSRSQSRYNILSTHIPFVPCQSALPFLGCSYFKIWHWKFKVKVISEVKVKVAMWVQHSVDSHPFRSMSMEHPIPELQLFKIWPWKSRVKVMGEVTLQSHNVGLTSYWLTPLSFNVNRASHSWVMTFSKFDLENQGSRSWVRSHFKVTMWIWHPIDSHPDSSCNRYSSDIAPPPPVVWSQKTHGQGTLFPLSRQRPEGLKMVTINISLPPWHKQTIIIAE